MKEEKISKWVKDLPKKGFMTFSLTDVIEKFPDTKRSTLVKTMYRLAEKNEIQSVWRGFYAIMPPEYALKGEIPPLIYMDDLMKYLNKTYYLGLLDAAAFYGAAHQRSQVTTLITSGLSLRNSEKKNTKIVFFTKKNISFSLLQQKKTKTGYIYVSSPELTAADLLFYEKRLGGLQRAFEVIREMGSAFDFSKVDGSFFSTVPLPVIQRLGYILSLSEETITSSEILYHKAKDAGLRFRFTLLKTLKDKPVKLARNEKWKIIINQTIDEDI